MSGEDWRLVLIAFIGSLPLLLGAIIAGWVTIKKLNVIHDTTNSLAKERSDLHAEGARTEGELRGRREGREAAMTEEKDRKLATAEATALVTHPKDQPPVASTKDVTVIGETVNVSEKDKREKP
jgi:hypothetical protein